MSQAPQPDLARPEPGKPETERLLAMLCYGLFLLAFANGLTAFIGVVLAYLRRAPAYGTIYQSHYANLIIVFWVTLVVGLLGFALMLNGIVAGLTFFLWPAWHFHPDGRFGSHMQSWHMQGWHMFGLGWAAMSIPVMLLAGAVLAVWYFYRVLGGFIRALDEKPY